MSFKIGKEYKKTDLYKILSIPKEKQRGHWETGYARYNDIFYLFVNIESAGRTGHNYNNFWDGDELHWKSRNSANINQPMISSMLSGDFHVHIFTRDQLDKPFTYEGEAQLKSYKDTSPVQVIWSFDETPNTKEIVIPEQIRESEIIYEGVGKKITINKYERNPEARRKCIQHYGIKCMVCEFDFEKIYGELGKGYIHVHHIKPISEIGEEYVIDPIKDLVPVCPNCHAMIHRKKETLSIDELKNYIIGT